MRTAVVTSILALILAGCPSPQYRPGGVPAVAHDIAAHKESGIPFPDQIGQLHRDAVKRYDNAGRDVSAGYNPTNASRPLVATIYIYPSPPITSIGSPREVIEEARSTL